MRNVVYYIIDPSLGPRRVIIYPMLSTTFLLIMYQSNILLCTMFLFINYIPTPIGIYVSLSYSNLSDLLICYREQVWPLPASIILSTTSQLNQFCTERIQLHKLGGTTEVWVTDGV